ncbi:MAG: RagB/SusD family nutrient uptake outer membrane protein, partial [Bacteroidota bacterium]|nr:RagB/SusD family nutrient uptake outer membrane protein [Bacteroidota bacterium]
TIDDKVSSVEHADDNSGWRMVKYPFYPDSDGDKIYEADYAEIRLAEIYYSLAECKLREGKTLEAGNLLNKVRQRNYPAADYPTTLYEGTESPSGKVKLDMDEMLDEWGREFLGEMRRRTDLCRFNKFSQPWWDKTDTDPNHDILPLSRTALSSNPKLKQNPGYSK